MRSSRQHTWMYIEYLIIAIFWIAMIGTPFFFRNAREGMDWETAFSMSRPNIPLFLAFLINRFVLLPRLFFNDKRIPYVLAVLALVIFLPIGSALVFPAGLHRPDPPHMGGRESRPMQQLPPHMRHEMGLPPTDIRHRPFPNTLVSSFLCLLIIGVDTGLKSFTKLSSKEKEHAILEKENMENQLAFLRHQISPHFFMNTLNNIHSLIDIDTEEAKESIIRLSKLMRHLLYDSEAEQLSLKKEIAFIDSYVELMRLRYPKKVDIVLEVPDIIPEKHIPPLLFTSILENAFKYGISYSKSSFVHISLQSTDDALDFRVSNSNHQQSTHGTYSGIGLKNTLQRLDLIYQDRYSLKVQNGHHIFTVTLHIPL
ncbi:MAG: histidine kinase [Bacteroidota bacterium]